MKRLSQIAWIAGTWVVRSAVVVFCLAPVVLILVLSLFRDVFQTFPPQHPSLELWGELFRSVEWRDAVIDSLRIAVPASVLTVAVLVPMVVALQRGRVRARGLFETAALAPMLIPITAYVLSIYIIFLDLHLIGSWLAIVVIEAAIAMPVTFIVLQQGARMMDGHLEFVAMSLGATKRRAVIETALAIMRPAILTAFLFSFLFAFDDAVFISFLSGPQLNTVSQDIFNSLRFSVDPLIAPLSALLMTSVIVVALTTTVIQRAVARRSMGRPIDE